MVDKHLINYWYLYTNINLPNLFRCCTGISSILLLVETDIDLIYHLCVHVGIIVYLGISLKCEFNPLNQEFPVANKQNSISSSVTTDITFQGNHPLPCISVDKALREPTLLTNGLKGEKRKTLYSIMYAHLQGPCVKSSPCSRYLIKYGRSKEPHPHSLDDGGGLNGNLRGTRACTTNNFIISHQ